MHTHRRRRRHHHHYQYASAAHPSLARHYQCRQRRTPPRLSLNVMDVMLGSLSHSDGKSASIGVLTAGGFADKAAHDAFCPKMDCVISNIFDQSPQKNHLGKRHGLVNASRHSITVGKDKTPVYGMWFDPGFGCEDRVHLLHASSVQNNFFFSFFF